VGGLWVGARLDGWPSEPWRAIGSEHRACVVAVTCRTHGRATRCLCDPTTRCLPAPPPALIGQPLCLRFVLHHPAWYAAGVQRLCEHPHCGQPRRRGPGAGAVDQLLSQGLDCLPSGLFAEWASTRLSSTAPPSAPTAALLAISVGGLHLRGTDPRHAGWSVCSAVPSS